MDAIASLVMAGGAAVLVGALAYLYRQYRAEEADRIAQLIDGNRATPRPGMERRDDALLTLAEDRARSRRARC